MNFGEFASIVERLIDCQSERSFPLFCSMILASSNLVLANKSSNFSKDIAVNLAGLSNVTLTIELLNDYLDGGYYKYISNEIKLVEGWQIINIKEIIKVS